MTLLHPSTWPSPVYRTAQLLECLNYPLNKLLGAWQQGVGQLPCLSHVAPAHTVPGAQQVAAWSPARRGCVRGPHLHAQADGVEHDEGKHQVLKVGRGDQVPHLVLVRVLGDVAPQGAGLQGVLHTLALRWNTMAGRQLRGPHSSMPTSMGWREPEPGAEGPCWTAEEKRPIGWWGPRGPHRLFLTWPEPSPGL